jgi:hypothetical protein
MQGQPMKKMMRKKNRPKIQLKKGFISLCMHLTVMKETQEDSATIKTYPANTKLSNQANKDDVHDCQGKTAYVRALLNDSLRMYVYVKGKTVYVY